MFQMRKTVGRYTRWRCVVRTKKNYCRAWILQDGRHFYDGLPFHCHPSDPGNIAKVKVTVLAKKLACSEPHLPASAVARKALLEYRDEEHPPKLINVVRAVNRARQKMRTAKVNSA